MARRFKLRDLEMERGRPLSELIPELLERHEGKQTAVAKELGVSQASISDWLKTNGFVQVVKWEREIAS